MTSPHFSPRVTLNVRYAPLMPQFLALRRAELPEIAALIARGDFPALARIGHNLHGAGASYGLDALTAWGEEFEVAASAQDGKAAAQTYADLRHFLGALEVSYRNTVLFVDDQPEITALLQRLFSHDEYICFFAQSAAQALEILENHAVDVLVSDLVMPDMGGLELLSIARERFPEVVRLVLSGQSQVPSILAAINTGQVFRYLTKPWRVDAQARGVIAEAVAHANERNYTDAGEIRVAPHALCALLDATGRDYVILEREERVLAASQARGQEFAPGTRAVSIAKRGAQCVQLDAAHCAYIWD